MPTISVFYGIMVHMYWRDHAPPHVHVFYQGQGALFEIETGRMIAGRLYAAAAGLMTTWVLLHRDALRLVATRNA